MIREEFSFFLSSEVIDEHDSGWQVIFIAKMENGRFRVTWEDEYGLGKTGVTYSIEEAQFYVRNGVWIVV